MTVPSFAIERHFAGSRMAMWKAWTQPSLLAQWLGPKGSTVTVIKCAVKPGGSTFSSFAFPGEPMMWGKFAYREVIIPTRLVWLHSFADADGNIARHPFNDAWPLQMMTTVDMEEALAAQTKVTLTWVPHNASPAEQEAFAEGMDSMRTGWGGSFDQLGALLAKG